MVIYVVVAPISTTDFELEAGRASLAEGRRIAVRTLIVVALLAAVLCVFVLQVLHYMPYIADDALISLRYSHRLLAGHGLTWTDGHRVEGYSNLLWVLMVAGLGAFGVDLVGAARILGVFGMISVMATVTIYYVRTRPGRGTWFPLLAGLFFYALAAPIAIWAIGGMEQPLIAALLGLAMPLAFAVAESDRTANRTSLLLSLVLGLLCITRPDGVLYTVAAVVGIAICRRVSGYRCAWRVLLRVISFPVMLLGGQVLFRVAYYGEVLPNTALVKISPSAHHWLAGMKYVGLAILSLAPLSFVAIVLLVVLLVSHERRQRAILMFTTLLLWLAYLAFIGGDIFAGYRHAVPVVVVLVYAMVEGLLFIRSHVQRLPRPFPGLLSVALVVLYIPYFYVGASAHRNQAALRERWEWDGQVTGLLLKEAFGKEQPLVAVSAAGCVPYWSELPALDMLGLNDYYLPRHPPKNKGLGLIGHELGDAEYVLGRKPDIVVFHCGVERIPIKSLSGLETSEEFLGSYVPVKVRGTRPHEYMATLWVRKYGEKLGIRQTADEIRVPGFLLSDNRNTVAFLDKDGKLAVPISAGHSAGVSLELVDENWNIEVDCPAPGLVTSKIVGRVGEERVVLTTAGTDPVEVRGLVLRRRAAFPGRP